MLSSLIILLIYALLLSNVVLVLQVEAVQLPGPQEIFDSYEDVLRTKYEDSLKTSIVHGESVTSGIHSLLIDSEREQLIIGGKNSVVRLGAKDLNTIEKWTWNSDQQDVVMCRMKGRTEEECNNFIRTVALTYDHEKLLICGTHAYSPHCQWKSPIGLNSDDQKLGLPFSGIGVVPYSPEYPHAYVMSAEDELYSGVATDFEGHDSSILRVLPEEKLLRTAKANNRWLNDPTFIAAMEFDNFIYFFFRETAVELKTCGSPSVGRVARICKNDIGGDTLLEGIWTTYNKATLKCASFTRLESVSIDIDRQLIFAAFTNQNYKNEASGTASAICVYKLASFRRAFEAKYLYQRSEDEPWITHINNYRYFDCGVKKASSARPGMTLRSLQESQKYQLMAEPVEPVNPIPLSSSALESYVHIISEAVRVKHYGIFQVVFVLTKIGLLKKYTLIPQPLKKGNHRMNVLSNSKACLTEVIQALPPNMKNVTLNDLKIFKKTKSLYISSSLGLFKIPVQRCHRFKTRKACVEAGDPYCGWDSRLEKCTPAPGGRTQHHYWHQDVHNCPKTDNPVNGGWSDWSDWTECPYSSGGSKKNEDCQCRQRKCDSPIPRRGGTVCNGPDIEVTNCTRNGEWSTWSSWSGCSTTCGVSVRSRSRTCTNPSPAFGGRICLGADDEQEYCPVPDCPPPKLPPVHGGWSLWGAWEHCSRKCDGGMTKRKRSCNNPRPANDGNECSGCHIEYKSCNTEQCDEVRRWSEWTSWLQGNTTSPNQPGVWVKRYKFACVARIHDPKLLGVSKPRAEEKFCQKDTDDCTDTAFQSQDGGWSSWSEWSSCTRECGGGTRSRFRSCTNPAPQGTGQDCSGHAKEKEECNNHSCYAEWMCWSEWKECSVTCGRGVKHRFRSCDRLTGMEDCSGRRVESLPCNEGACTQDGYGEWTGWSVCSQLSVKVRVRPCLSSATCNGRPDAQMRKCDENEVNPSHYVQAGFVPGVTGGSDRQYLVLMLCLAAAFILGIGITVCLICVAVRRQWHCCYTLGMKPTLSTPISTTCSNSSRGSSAPLTPSAKNNNVYSPSPPLLLTSAVTGDNTNRIITTAAQHQQSNNNNLILDGSSVRPPPVPNLVLNPLLNEIEHEHRGSAGLVDVDGNLTLRRTMRASMNTKDYL